MNSLQHDLVSAVTVCLAAQEEAVVDVPFLALEAVVDIAAAVQTAFDAVAEEDTTVDHDAKNPHSKFHLAVEELHCIAPCSQVFDHP